MIWFRRVKTERGASILCATWSFSDGGLTNEEWDAWKLDTLANKLYFCPDFDGTPGYNTSADGWW